MMSFTEISRNLTAVGNMRPCDHEIYLTLFSIQWQLTRDDKACNNLKLIIE